MAHAVTYALFGALLVTAHASSPNADYWVRLASGRLVVNEHIIPRHDPFTFTAHGADWLDHEWLLGAAMYATNSVSYELLVVIAAALALAPFAMMHRIVLADRKDDWSLVLLVALAVFCSWRNFGVRPQLINPLFFVALIWIIDARRRRGSPWIWLAVPLCFAWANLQAGFLVGPAVLAAWSAVCVAERRDAALSFAILLASLAVPILNAYGIELYAYTISASLFGNVDRSVVPEWQSLDFHDVLNLPTLVALLVLPYFGVRSEDRFRQVLALGTTAAALISARFTPFFALALVYVMAPQLPELRPPRAAVLLMAAIATVLATVLTASVVRTSAQDPPLDHAPAEGLSYLRAAGPDARVYAIQSWGSYLTYEGWTTFFDTRTHQVFSEDLISDYHKVERTQGDWEAVLRRWDIEYVMAPPDTDLAEALDGAGWTRVFEGSIEVIWRRLQGMN